MKNEPVNENTSDILLDHDLLIWRRIFRVSGVDELKIPKDNKFSMTLLLELKDGIIKKWGGSRIITLKPGELTEEEREAQTYYKVIKNIIQDQAPDVAKYDNFLDFFNKYDTSNPISLLIALIKKYYLVILTILAVIAFVKYIFS